MTRNIVPVLILTCSGLFAADRSLKDNPDLERYFEAEVSTIEQQQSLFNYQSLEEWKTEQPKLRAQLFDMLGLHPLPERTPLDATVTGTVQEADFRVENVHFQSAPGLYVTANLYLPKVIEEPLPAVLYVCGHGGVKKNNVSLGNKTHYQHHGAWFARNGYACLTIDTLQLGEIEGIHHGTYRYNRWWWNARGYTPAGVEAWNCIRALDYLESRPEIDSSRFGVTGRSGGGAYSWWVAALDERIRCAVPVAGITSLRNHVVDGCVEGHCDCMYMVNTFRWDYAKVAALVAPRPLLISNSDKDGIFPLEGVVDVHRQVRHIYELYDQPQHLGLQITEGPHKDTQELRVHAFHWLNRWLRNDDSLIETTAVKFFEPEQLKVFASLPDDERNTSIDEDFAPAPKRPWKDERDDILNHQQDWLTQARSALRTHSFAAWPDDSRLTDAATHVEIEPLSVSPSLRKSVPGLVARRLRFDSQANVPLFIDLFFRSDAAASEQSSAPLPATMNTIALMIVDSPQWANYAASCLVDKNGQAGTVIGSTPESPFDAADRIREMTVDGNAVAVFAPRGTGPHAWKGDERKQIQIRRRFQLIGTTVDAMRAWDIRGAMSVLKGLGTKTETVEMEGANGSAWLALTALMFEDEAVRGRVIDIGSSREDLPVYLNAGRQFGAEHLLLLALSRAAVRVINGDPQLIESVTSVTSDSRWKGRKLQTQ